MVRFRVPCPSHINKTSLDMQDIVAAHKHSSNHREEIEQSSLCGCFYCLATFVPTEIHDWIDWPPGTPDDLELECGTTALCPRCGIDSVIGSASGFETRPAFLTGMQKHWF